MAVRGDITVNWDLSPRLITVAAPSTQLNMQDLVDTIRSLEDDLGNMDNPSLLSAAGKEDLGGSVSVGITVTLQNAKVAFEERTTSVSVGTVTTATVFENGRILLIDSAATFETDGVLLGATVFNETDRSVGTILRVDSETQLTVSMLADGTDNDFDVSDSYKIWNEIQCDLEGGNLVALDTTGTSVSPVFPTFGVQVVRTSSASATLTEATLNEQTRFLVESQRTTHAAFGDPFYVDPVNGSDTNSGSIPDQPLKTVAAALAKVQDGHHDVIFLAAPEVAITNITENVVIDKSYTFIRGPGRDVCFKGASSGSPSITIDADGVEISGVEVQSPDGGTDPAVRVTATSNNARVQSFITAATGDGIEVLGGSGHLITDCIISDVTGDGISLADSVAVIINRCDVMNSTGNGLTMTASSPLATRDCVVAECIFTGNGGDDLNIGTNVARTRVAFSVIFASMVDNGLGTFDGTAGIGGPV